MMPIQQNVADIFPWQSSMLMASARCHDASVKKKTMGIVGGYSPAEETVAGNRRLLGRRIAFTTPAGYADRLSHLLQQEGAEPLWCPTVVVESTAETKSQFLRCIWGENDQGTESTKSSLDICTAIAFTSRAGISAFAEALEGRESPLSKEGGPFMVAALGRDAQLLDDLKICRGNPRVRILVPATATPQALADELGDGSGCKILCPVPLVLGLDEPPVVPDFLKALRTKGWNAIRLNAYVTSWAGPECAASLLDRGAVDAIIFTSTCEVQGLLKSLRALGVDWKMWRINQPQLLVAAHGPVSASGARRLGVDIDVVSSQFHSFAGVVDALALRWGSVNEEA